MKQISSSITILCIFLIFSTNPIAATNISVSNNNDADFRSIQEAIDNATIGDNVLVYPGIYTENVNVNKEITIISHSSNSEDTIVQTASTKKNVFIVTSNNVTINGFKMLGAVTDKHGEDNAGVYLYNKTGILIINNNITGNNLGILSIEAHNNTIKNNIIIDNTLSGIDIWDSDNNLIQGNYVARSRDNGILLWERCYNNTLIGNYVSSSRRGVGIQQYSSNTTLINNTATGNINGFFLTRSDNCTFINNTANSNRDNGIYFATSKNSHLENNTATKNGKSGFFMHFTLSSNLVRNIASENQDYGIVISNYSKNNILECNIMKDNGKGDIHFVEEGNRVINSSCNDKVPADNVTANTTSDDSQKIPSPGILTTFVLVVATYLLMKFQRHQQG
ncbi:MAG: NosD domain-containing protein [Methanolobus sp.]|jgi:parallel beta-helix repeat protein|nr:NosD domain-containing protein [Methanolobus sp.]